MLVTTGMAALSSPIYQTDMFALMCRERQGLDTSSLLYEYESDGCVRGPAPA